MKEKKVLPQIEKGQREFLPKSVSLLLEEEKSVLWEKAKKIIKTAALAVGIIFLAVSLLTFSYFWFLSSYGESLKKRAHQARQRISSLRKEEETYLTLIKKLKMAQQTLDSRQSMPQLLKVADSLFPPEATPSSLTVRDDGYVTASLFCPSLAKLESLNENLTKAIDEGKIAETKIGSIIKDEAAYKLNVSFQVKEYAE